jgi:hydroxymethylbilane synthase
MPLAAHAVWQADMLCIDVALGHAQELSRPLLRTQWRERVASDADALALGARAAAQLRASGAESYLSAAV